MNDGVGVWPAQLLQKEQGQGARGEQQEQGEDVMVGPVLPPTAAYHEVGATVATHWAGAGAPQEQEQE